MKALTPEVFNLLIYVVIIVGLIAAALRIRSDFRCGPRWPDTPNANTTATTAESTGAAANVTSAEGIATGEDTDD